MHRPARKEEKRGRNQFTPPPSLRADAREAFTGRAAASMCPLSIDPHLAVRAALALPYLGSNFRTVRSTVLRTMQRGVYLYFNLNLFFKFHRERVTHSERPHRWQRSLSRLLFHLRFRSLSKLRDRNGTRLSDRIHVVAVAIGAEVPGGGQPRRRIRAVPAPTSAWRGRISRDTALQCNPMLNFVQLGHFLHALLDNTEELEQVDVGWALLAQLAPSAPAP